MRRFWVLAVSLGLCASLLVVGAALADDGVSGMPDPPEPPKAVAGLYVTSEDNENNAGTGVADDDMGGDPPFLACTGMANLPIEFNIVVGEEICLPGQLSLAAYGFETGLHEVYVNGNFVGLVPVQQGGGWEVLEYAVPQAALEQGENLVEILFVGQECAYVAWGTLAIEPCAEEEFVPELGSVMLLGSGLMGLAGYATLRLRSGQALRWRTRQ